MSLGTCVQTNEGLINNVLHVLKLIYQGLLKKKSTTGKRNSSSCYNNSSHIMYNTCTYFFHNFILQHVYMHVPQSAYKIDAHVFISVITCLLKACTWSCITDK